MHPKPPLLCLLLALSACSFGDDEMQVGADPVSLDTAALPPQADPAEWADRQVDQLDQTLDRATFHASALAAVRGYEAWVRDMLDRLPEEAVAANDRRQREEALGDVRTSLRRIGHDLEELPEDGWREASHVIAADLRVVQTDIARLAPLPPESLRR